MSRIRFDFEDNSAVRLDGVSLSYGKNEDILREVDLTLAQGSFSFLTGPSGAGKSTLLKLMYLALAPGRGDVCLFGRSTRLLKRRDLVGIRRRIGVVFQEFRLLNYLNAFENVALPLRVAGQKLASYQNEVEDLLRWVGLSERIGARPSELSGGEQQRVAIARALINKPDLLIADEPTGNVDPEMSRKILRLFMELNKRFGTTVVIATHDLGIVEEFNRPAYHIQQGRLRARRKGGAT